MNTGRHEDGDCSPNHCRRCAEELAYELEDHERNVCDRYPNCRFCEDEHDCDKSFEPLCRSCMPPRG